jgi:hypothetical protein
VILKTQVYAKRRKKTTHAVKQDMINAECKILNTRTDISKTRALKNEKKKPVKAILKPEIVQHAINTSCQTKDKGGVVQNETMHKKFNKNQTK